MINQHQPTELITYETARQLLGVKPSTLRKRIIEDGLIRYVNPIDRRTKLLDRAAVEQLLKFDVFLPRERVA